MHSASVWSLHSDHPQLSVFHSGDRSGLVAKTDIRGVDELDGALSLAIAQEHEGINNLAVAQGYFWTATSSSSINRWRDVDIDNEPQKPDSQKQSQFSSTTAPSKVPSTPPQSPASASTPVPNQTSSISPSNVLRVSNNLVYASQKARFAEATGVYPGAGVRKMSEAVFEQESDAINPVLDLPEETVEGQYGLIKHVLLNDRRRVLTLDTAGEVMMWDLLKVGFFNADSIVY